MGVALVVNIAHPGNLPPTETPIRIIPKEWIFNVLTKTKETGTILYRAIFVFNVIRVYIINLLHFRINSTPIQKTISFENKTGPQWTDVQS